MSFPTERRLGRTNPMATDARGKYRIQSVSEMTGVAAATLRAWERRYGIPIPARTSSSYRVYSDVDIEMIRRLRVLCDGGMSPSEAARLILDEADSPQPTLPSLDSTDPFAPMRAALVRAIELFDPRQLDRELDRATALGTATTIVEQVLRPVLAQIGQAWHDGHMSIAQEHLATEAITAATRRLLGLVQPDGEAPTILLACFADDEHGYAPVALGVHLATWGWRVVILGARTPPAAIKYAADELEPQLIGMSCTAKMTPQRARELVQQYADAVGDIPWIVGGFGVSQVAPLVLASGGHVSDDFHPKTLRTMLDGIARPTKTRR